MSILLLVAGLVVVAVVAALVTGRLDAALPEPTGSSPHRALPPGRVEAAAVDDVRFSLAVRGYRMDEVDEVLDRLRAALAERDAVIERLTGGRLAARGAGGHDPTGTGELAAASGAAPAAEPPRRSRRARTAVGED